MQKIKQCEVCKATLRPRPTRMGPAPRYCSVACRRVRENELARAARRARTAAHWARELGGAQQAG